nr:class I histocompatibility antigen, F10 alpha chain-like [Nerophis lumbriciformis]
MNLFLLVLLVVQMHSVTPVIHTLQYFTTASSQVPNFPEYVIVGYVDGVEISYYDSNIRKTESKQDWMNKITAEDPKYWQIDTEISVGHEFTNKHNLEILKKRFNQTGGVHIFQWMYGCEWNDETDEVKGWQQSGYDGEDYISLDMKTWTWTAAKPQAFPDKLKWDQNIFLLDDQKYYYTELCPSYLKKYVKNGKKVLMRTELPEVFLLQKTPSSPVTCMATGFYPNLADLFWRKDGEQIFEDVEHGELLPNHDGTFQMSVELKVEVTAEVEGKYECVFQLSGVKEDLVTKLERRSILSNASPVPLESTFMSQLDRYTPKLLELFSAKGGVTGQRIKNLLMELIQDPSASAVMKRDVTLRCLGDYMGESGQELISDYCGSAETTVHEDLEMKNMSIYICREPNAVGIIIEGVPVLTHLGNLAKACCLPLGLTERDSDGKDFAPRCIVGVAMELVKQRPHRYPLSMPCRYHGRRNPCSLEGIVSLKQREIVAFVFCFVYIAEKLSIASTTVLIVLHAVALKRHLV